MKIHLQRELEALRKNLFHLSSMVEENLRSAIRAVYESDSALAAEVRTKGQEVDRLEVQVEEECLKILALHQPVAVDLRFVIAVLKMTNDLERIDDMAENIAGGRNCMSGESMPAAFNEHLHVLGELARAMLRKSLEALMDMNVEKAEAVMRDDDAVDAKYYEMMRLLCDQIANHPQDAEKLMCWMLVAKNIERVADLATNIAEDTIYTVTGEIVRHSHS